MKKNKKILQVISKLDSGGAEKVVVDICNLLIKKNYEVTILFTRSPGPLSKFLNPKVKQISLDRRNKFSLVAIVKCLKVLIDYDIIHVHTRHTFYYIKLIMSILPMKNWNLIFHDHGSEIDIDGRTPIFFQLFNNNYGYIGVSEVLCNWAEDNIKGLTNIYKLPNIRVVNNSNKSDDLEKIAKDETTLRFVHVSNIHPIKNLEHSILLIDALKKEKKVSLTIYGAKSNKIYHSSLIKLINSLKLNDIIEIIDDELDIPSILSSYDFGLYTSKSETGPLVLIEYLCKGIPFLSFDTGEVVKTVKKNYPLFVINNFDVKKWENRIDDLLIKKYDKKEMVKFYNENFSTEVYLDNLIKIYGHF
jgi:glycosyltransferase involved in cell wall biosynthesis